MELVVVVELPYGAHQYPIEHTACSHLRRLRGREIELGSSNNTRSAALIGGQQQQHYLSKQHLLYCTLDRKEGSSIRREQPSANMNKRSQFKITSQQQLLPQNQSHSFATNQLESLLLIILLLLALNQEHKLSSLAGSLNWREAASGGLVLDQASWPRPTLGFSYLLKSYTPIHCSLVVSRDLLENRKHTHKLEPERVSSNNFKQTIVTRKVINNY